jgi:hypothetical protein
MATTPKLPRPPTNLAHRILSIPLPPPLLALREQSLTWAPRMLKERHAAPQTSTAPPNAPANVQGTLHRLRPASHACIPTGREPSPITLPLRRRVKGGPNARVDRPPTAQSAYHYKSLHSKNHLPRHHSRHTHRPYHRLRRHHPPHPLWTQNERLRMKSHINAGDQSRPSPRNPLPHKASHPWDRWRQPRAPTVVPSGARSAAAERRHPQGTNHPACGAVEVLRHPRKNQ